MVALTDTQSPFTRNILIHLYNFAQTDQSNLMTANYCILFLCIFTAFIGQRRFIGTGILIYTVYLLFDCDVEVTENL